MQFSLARTASRFDGKLEESGASSDIATRKTSQQDGLIPQQVLEQLMRQIMDYDDEFRREEATSAVGSGVKH